MTTDAKSLIAGIALMAVAAGRAQPSASIAPSGVLGQRLLDGSLGSTEERYDSHPRYNADMSATMPVQRNLDLRLGYQYSSFNPSFGPDNLFRVKETNQAVFAAMTAYAQTRPIKPFFAANFAYRWTRACFQTSKRSQSIMVAKVTKPRKVSASFS